jgi:glycosyltransferase involved in cell wall biosynthesis
MKVCFVSFEYPPMIEGGVGTYAVNLVEGLRQSEIDVHVITRGERTFTENKTYRLLTPQRLYWRRLYFLERAKSLFHALSKVNKFDLVHLNGTYPNITSFGTPTVSTLHAYSNLKQLKTGIQPSSFKTVNGITYLLLKTPVGGLFDFTTARMSKKLICPSTSLARDIMTSSFVDANKIQVVPNGINLKELDMTRRFDTSVLEKYGVQEGSFLLYIGRLSYFKGIEYLIEAFKDVRNEYAQLKLLIVGRGDFENHLRRVARDSRDVIFAGHVDSMQLKKLFYEASLAVVLPSTVDEVFPMVILEAMACSKPVIATNVGGVPLLIEHGKNGFLSRPKNSKELARFIRALCEDPSLGRKMGLRGRKKVEEEFTVDRMTSETLKVYETLLA